MMKISLVQLDYHIGNFIENTTNIVYHIKKAQQFNADLVVFSELSICGYPPLDFLEQKDFVDRCISEIKNIARLCKRIGVILGGPSLNPDSEGKMLFNSAYFLNEGIIKEVFNKSLLPTYDIFDEYRYFEPNTKHKILNFRDKKIAVTICEDLWDVQPVDNEFARARLYKQNPLDELMKFQPDFVVNIAASPFSHSRLSAKKSVFTEKAKKYGLPIIYVNQVGAQAELIFEGGSLAVNKDGTISEQLLYFSQDSKFIELEDLIENKKTIIPEETGRIKMIHDALVTGIKGYFEKTGFSKAVLGLSGGIDSAVTLVLAREALGADNVHSLLMPSVYSSDTSISDSIDLCNTLSCRFNILDIQRLFETFKNNLCPVFGDLPEDITEENIQSRIRGSLLMAYSNKFGSILLNTSNKSESAVGYGTLYGDMNGGISVLGDVYKTDVYRLAEYINRNKEIIPINIITKAPSAELRAGQKDSDSLPEYNILDKILYEYIEKQKSTEQIISEGFDEDLVYRIAQMITQSEHKRYQSPPVLRISSRAFGAGRRMPLVAKYQ